MLEKCKRANEVVWKIAHGYLQLCGVAEESNKKYYSHARIHGRQSEMQENVHSGRMSYVARSCSLQPTILKDFDPDTVQRGI